MGKVECEMRQVKSMKLNILELSKPGSRGSV